MKRKLIVIKLIKFNYNKKSDKCQILNYFFNFTYKTRAAELYKFPCSSSAPAPGEND